MIIIIDGYNLIKQLLSTDAYISEKERHQVLKILSEYAQRKKHTLLVVFDGGPYDWPHKERISQVPIVYSGCNDTADDYIMNYLEEHQTKDILLVSSDHEIGLFASDLDIPSIASHDFFGLVQKAIKEPVAIELEGEVVTLSDESNDLDTIMREGSRTVPVKQEDIQPSKLRQRPPKRASKVERKLYQKLKKL